MSERLFRQGDRLQAASLNKLGFATQGWQQYALTFPHAEPGPWVLPAAGSRAGGILGFDGSGAPLMVPMGAVTDMVVATGSTEPRSLSDRFAERRNVRDFGAKGDGTTDDTAAIQAAIASLSARGGEVYFPPGDYRFTGLLINTHNITLRGASSSGLDIARGVRLIYAGDPAGDWIAVENNGLNCFCIDEMLIKPVSADYATGGCGLRMEKQAGQATTGSWTIRRVTIIDCWNGIDLRSCAIGFIQTTRVTRYLGDFGLRLWGDINRQTSNIRVDSSIFAGNLATTPGAAIKLEGNVASCWFNDCYGRSGNYGLHSTSLTGVTDDWPGGIYFSQFAAETCRTSGIFLEVNGSFTFDRPWIGNSGQTAAHGGSGPGVRVSGAGRGVVKFTDMHIGSSGEHGVEIGPGLVFVSLINANIGNSGVNDVGLSTRYDGVHVLANTERWQIIGGMIGGGGLVNPSFPKQRFGVYIGSGCANFLISGCDLRGNGPSGSTPLFDGGSFATKSYIVNCIGYATEASGTAANVTPGTNGIVTIAHGLRETPTYANVALLGDTVNNGVEVQAIDGSEITARVFNEATGADVTSGTFSIMWHVREDRA